MMVLVAMKKDVMPTAYGQTDWRFLCFSKFKHGLCPPPAVWLGLHFWRFSASLSLIFQMCLTVSASQGHWDGYPGGMWRWKVLQFNVLCAWIRLFWLLFPPRLFPAPIPRVNDYDLMLEGREDVYYSSPLASTEGKLWLHAMSSQRSKPCTLQI